MIKSTATVAEAFLRMGLEDNEMEAIRELFLNFDSNSDGTISNRELQHFINSIQGKPDG